MGVPKLRIVQDTETARRQQEQQYVGVRVLELEQKCVQDIEQHCLAKFGEKRIKFIALLC